MLEHSAILSIFIKLPFAIKICVLSIFEWPIYTGLTEAGKRRNKTQNNTGLLPMYV